MWIIRRYPFEILALRFRYAASLSYGPREIAIMITSLWFRCTIIQVKLSAKKEQCGYAASKLGWNINLYTTNWILTSKSSGRVCFHLVTKDNFLLTTTKDRSRRCWLSPLRRIVHSFSFSTRILRHSTHSFSETIW